MVLKPSDISKDDSQKGREKKLCNAKVNPLIYYNL